MSTTGWRIRRPPAEKTPAQARHRRAGHQQPVRLEPLRRPESSGDIYADQQRLAARPQHLRPAGAGQRQTGPDDPVAVRQLRPDGRRDAAGAAAHRFSTTARSSCIRRMRRAMPSRSGSFRAIARVWPIRTPSPSMRRTGCSTSSTTARRTGRSVAPSGATPGKSAADSSGPTGNNLGLYRREIVNGSSKFGPPSVTVFSADASGDAVPLRVIEGPKTQLELADRRGRRSGTR